MTRTALAVSPHLDDAVFSAGATLAGLARDGWRVLVATVFTGNVARPSGFALECQTSKGLAADVDYMALRRAEDLDACRAISAEPIHLPLLEAPHRGYNDARALFGAPLADDEAWSSVPEALARLAAEVRPGRVLAPRAVGGHVDHLIVHQVVRGLNAAETWWWRDWPYDDRADAPDPFAADLSAHAERFGPDDEFVRAAKRAGCGAYASQLGFQFGGAASLDARLARAGPEHFATAQVRPSSRPARATLRPTWS